MEDKKIKGEEYAVSGTINYEIVIGKDKGNSTETTVKISSEIFTDNENAKEYEFKIFGNYEREALSVIFKKISEELNYKTTGAKKL